MFSVYVPANRGMLPGGRWSTARGLPPACLPRPVGRPLAV